MVLSNTKRTSSVKSITSMNQGGGTKKAGLPHHVGREYGFSIALKTHQTRNTLFDMTNTHGVITHGLRHTVNENVNFSRPIGRFIR